LASLTPGRFKTRFIENIKVKGKSQSVKVLEMSGWQAEAEQMTEIIT